MPSLDELVLFFRVNRFLFDVIMGSERPPAMSDIAHCLTIPKSSLTGGLRVLGLPTVASRLWDMARSLAERVVEAFPPPVFLVICSMPPGDRLDLRYIELSWPVCPCHVDFNGLLSSRICCLSDHKLLLFFASQREPAPDFSPSSTASAFRGELSFAFSNLPDLFLNLTNDDRFLFNNQLSICFLYGQVTYPAGDIASPHLQGTFSLYSRKADTGYFVLDSTKISASENARQGLRSLFDWLKTNNPLYRDALSPPDFSVFSIIADASDDFIGSVVNPYIRDHYLRHSLRIDSSLRVPVRYENVQNDAQTVRIPLEPALGYTFPLLFPFGPPSTIPGDTFREKAVNFLSAHPFYRCGRLQFNLVLWFYHLIAENKARYYNRHISLQHVRMPNDASRNVPNHFPAILLFQVFGSKSKLMCVLWPVFSVHLIL